MGNCQAAEAVVIHHPGPAGGRVERLYWSVAASHVMAANPGHYVAVIVSSTSRSHPQRGSTTSSISSSCTASVATDTTTVKHLKLLRPDDTLQIGHVYRLVSFEEVLREFATKKHVKLSKLLIGNKARARGSRRSRSDDGGGTAASSPATAESMETKEEEAKWVGSGISSSSSRRAARQGQWRPALQSISEVVGS